MIKSLLRLVKHGLPDRDVLLPVLAGPFRGARFFSNPQVAMRKVFGVYEHELTGWLNRVLPQADVVLDVGANDGYFTFGAAKAMRRAGRPVRVIAIEMSSIHLKRLEEARTRNGFSESEISIVAAAAAASDGPGTRSLDSVATAIDSHARVFVKIDIEGAEGDALAGGRSLLHPRNFFLVEVHTPALHESLPPMFASAGLDVHYINQQAHPVLGRERRVESNWWLVSTLPDGPA